MEYPFVTFIKRWGFVVLIALLVLAGNITAWTVPHPTNQRIFFSAVSLQFMVCVIDITRRFYKKIDSLPYD